MRRCLALLPLILLVSACGPSTEDIVNEYRVRAEPRIAKLKDAAKKAAAETGEPRALALKDKLTFKGDGANCALAHAELFESPKGKPKLDLILGDMWLSVPQDALKDPGEYDTDFLRQSFENLVGMKYLALIVTRTCYEPVHMSGKDFTPGAWEADVLVVDIDKVEVVGGVRVKAANSDKVQVDMSKIDSWLHSNLWENARKAVNEGLKPHTSGAAIN